MPLKLVIACPWLFGAAQLKVNEKGKYIQNYTLILFDIGVSNHSVCTSN